MADIALAGTMRVALAPFRDRLPSAILEQEILRVVATIAPNEGEDPLSVAREEILRWARNRAGKVLPPEAWLGKPFEVLAAGRTILAASVEIEQNELWSLRADDPDKSVPERWRTSPFLRGSPMLRVVQTSILFISRAVASARLGI